MKIEIKKFRHFPEMTEETNAFHATLYINDRRTAIIRDRGHGGAIEVVQMFENYRFEQFILKCKQQPPVMTDMVLEDGELFSYPYSWEHAVGELVEWEINRKYNGGYGQKYVLISPEKDEILKTEWKKSDYPISFVRAYMNSQGFHDWGILNQPKTLYIDKTKVSIPTLEEK